MTLIEGTMVFEVFVGGAIEQIYILISHILVRYAEEKNSSERKTSKRSLQ